jgi:GntR family histidine utilization transcriptional repressor
MSVQAATEKTGFREVKAAILKRIGDGVLKPGALLPSEGAMAAEFGVSRPTVNRAMRDLAEAGVLDRRRRAGTRVRLAPAREARFAIPVVRDEIEATGAEYRYLLIEDVEGTAPREVQARLGLGPADRVRRILCLHSAGTSSYQLEERWISLKALREARWVPFHKAGPAEWLIATVPFSEVEVSFSAEAADAAWAGYLAMEPGEPVFTVRRTTWWQGMAITHVRLRHHRGYRMVTRY